MTRSRIVLLVIVSIFLVTTAETCGPAFDGLVFTRKHGPDAPISAFANGKIGIPLPSWWRAYLVVTYRYLESKPLSPAEARSFAAFWGPEENIGFPSDPANQALEKWVRARGQYDPEGPQSLKAYKEHGFNSQLNCTASAFTTAVDTLHARAQRFGAKSEELRQWVAGQDAVFENCAGDKANTVYPSQLPEKINPILRADRAYQVAAAHFYSGEMLQAKADFDAISQDAASPWQSIAPYLAARAVLRQVSDNLDEYPEPERLAKDVALMKDAEQRLKAVINDPNRSQWHHDTQKLLNLIAFRTDPLQYQHRLAKVIAGGGTGEDFGQNVRDYTLLLSKYLDDELGFPGIDPYGEEYDKKVAQWRREQYKTLQGERSDDLSDWIITFQSDSKAAWQHAIKKWQATKSVAWLYVALTKLSGADAESSAAIEAAANIEPESPSFVALNYQRARLLQGKGDLAGAREVVEKILATKKELSLSTLNLVQDEQMKLSQDLAGFVSQLVRQPVRMTYDWYTDDEEENCYDPDCKITFYGTKKPGKNSPLLSQFDPAAAQLLNAAIPTELLIKVVQGNTLPDHLQRRMAPAVWARAALLNQPELADLAGDAAVVANPELKRFVQEFAAAKDAEERRFVAAFAVSHFPGLRPFVESALPRETEFSKINNFRDNWWCADLGAFQEASNYEKQWNARLKPIEGASPPASAFITPAQAQQAEGERKELLAMGSSYQYLPKTIIAWAKTHPDDPRVPEALHFSSRVSRYACYELTDKNDFSHQAFKILHKNYPQSEWTKKTKYWVK